jgi:hypothetical protein
VPEQRVGEPVQRDAHPLQHPREQQPSQNLEQQRLQHDDEDAVEPEHLSVPAGAEAVAGHHERHFDRRLHVDSGLQYDTDDQCKEQLVARTSRSEPGSLSGRRSGRLSGTLRNTTTAKARLVPASRANSHQ